VYRLGRVLDVHPDVWLPNQESFTKKYVDGAGTVQLSGNPYEGNQGFCVPTKFGKDNNITDIADLGRPDVAKLMDSDGNGSLILNSIKWCSLQILQTGSKSQKLQQRFSVQQ